MCAFVVLGLVFPYLWGPSLKWPILCRAGRKTTTQSMVKQTKCRLYLRMIITMIITFVCSQLKHAVCCPVSDCLSLVINLITAASFLQTFSSTFHEHFVDTFSWLTSLNFDVVHELSERCIDGTFSPAVVRRLLGILQYRFVLCNTSYGRPM